MMSQGECFASKLCSVIQMTVWREGSFEMADTEPTPLVLSQVTPSPSQITRFFPMSVTLTISGEGEGHKPLR